MASEGIYGIKCIHYSVEMSRAQRRGNGYIRAFDDDVPRVNILKQKHSLRSQQEVLRFLLDKVETIEG